MSASFATFPKLIWWSMRWVLIKTPDLDSEHASSCYTLHIVYTLHILHILHWYVPCDFPNGGIIIKELLILVQTCKKSEFWVYSSSKTFQISLKQVHATYFAKLNSTGMPYVIFPIEESD